MMLGYRSNRSNECNLLDQVLRQGEALRASMVRTILTHEPFYAENSKSAPPAGPANGPELGLHEKHACVAYMNGDPMSKDEEQRALDTFRSLSGSEICDLTARSFVATQNSCECETCRSYCRLHLNLMQNFKKTPSTEKTAVGKVCFGRKHDNFEVFQYADSLKVVLYSFVLTNEGKIKLCNANNPPQRAQKCISFEDMNVTYFIEYEVPVGISKCLRKQSKVDSGLSVVNFVKKCSKHAVKNVVYFKQITIHEVENLDLVNLEDVKVVFKITARTLRQKKSVLLGVAKFSFAEFYASPSLSCLQEVPVFLTEDSPIVTGSVRIQLQLGCGRLYFGKEFIDSLQNKENSTKIDLKSDENLNETFTLSCVEKFPVKTKALQINNEKTKDKLQQNAHVEKNSLNEDRKKLKHTKPKKVKNVEFNLVSPLPNKIILFGFIFVSDVEYYLPHPQTYFTCQPFCQQDYVCSNVTRGGRRTSFDYHQVIPYVYDEDFLFNLRENHMIVEFFLTQATTYGGDDVLGICKVPLHQYYLAFRNPVIVHYLTRNRLPVIGTDWCEPITDVASVTAVGNAQILVALGSEEQVKNLQKERGFMDDSVKRTKRVLQTVGEKSLARRDKILQTDADVDADVHTTPRAKVDKSTAVTPTLAQNKMADGDKTDAKRAVPMDDRLHAIQNYLQQIVEIKTNSQSQISPNLTADTQAEHAIAEAANANVAQDGGAVQAVPGTPTTGLLATLQGVMDGNGARRAFKAQIVVASALHLPARKKCRARKVKGKVVREELLPSTYVSYEIKDGVVKTTQVVQKSTSPAWHLKNEVSVPVDYLTNSNRRLLFKVWRKCNNGSTIPNMQIDTIIGFATVDLTVLLAGLPTIEGWFNIMDFSNKCNGQIKINVIPLEDISNIKKSPSTTNTSYTTTTPTSVTTTPVADVPAPQDETFSRALKRKFIELEEISQRLKARLNHVTEDLLPPQEYDQDANDSSADEFEKDINTLCVEDDYDLRDFAREAQDMNMHRVSTSLHQWKQGNPNAQELMITTHHNDGNSNNCNPEGAGCEQKQEMALHVAAPNETNDDDSHINGPDLTQSMKTFVPDRKSAQESDDPTVSSSSSSTCTLDRQLHEGKERIDHLLQRLTLLSTAQAKPPVDAEGAEGLIGFASRYVSGCSASQEPVSSFSGNLNLEADILSELGIDRDFDARKLFSDSLGSFNGNLEALLGRSFRDEPDGEGSTTESGSDDKLN